MENNEEAIDFKKIKNERLKKERKEKIKKNLNLASDWITDHKEVLTFIGLGLTGVAKVTRVAVKGHQLKKQKKLKDLYIYDRSLGKYLELKKPLNSSQLKTVLNRKENGEKLSYILGSMNLLK